MTETRHNLGADTPGSDVIEIAGITAYGFHGLLDSERASGQRFVADVRMYLDTRAAGQNDAIDETVDYAIVAGLVVEVLSGVPVRLIETLAERIAETVLGDARVNAVDVAVHKPKAPLGVEFADVVVRIHRTRLDDASTASGPIAAVDRQTPPGGEIEAPAPLTLPPTTPPSPRHTAPSPVLPAIPPVALPVVEPLGPEPEPWTGGEQALPAEAEDAWTPEAESDLDTTPVQPVEALLALGSNMDDPLTHLRGAIEDLAAVGGVVVSRISPLARTGAVGGPEGQPDYLNAVLAIRTQLSPRALLHAVEAIEKKHGRTRDGGRWAPRSLDIDIITYGTLLAQDDDLELPHPRAHQRAFVLLPWSVMAPNAFLPGLGGGPVAQLAEQAPDRDGIRWLVPDWQVGAIPLVGAGPKPSRAGGQPPSGPAGLVPVALDVDESPPDILPPMPSPGLSRPPRPSRPSVSPLPPTPMPMPIPPAPPTPPVPSPPSGRPHWRPVGPGPESTG